MFWRTPILVDEIRQLVNRIFRYRPRIRSTPTQTTVKDRLPLNGEAEIGTPIIVIGMNWLDVGGAEAFAVNTVELAASLGYRVIVLCDKDGPLTWLTKIEAFIHRVFMLGNLDASLRYAVCLRLILDYKPQILHIHHNLTLYRLLPLLRESGFNGLVMDTTHIVENRHGGFVAESVRHSSWIDIHHVISAGLWQFYTDAGITKKKLQLGYLGQGKQFRKKPARPSRPIKIGFVGRLVQQKRPYLFVELAKRLNATAAGSFTFEMIGEGLLSESIYSLASRTEARISMLTARSNVSDFLFDTDILVICSDQEGLTLVAFEAIINDCLVISTAVGSQHELIDQPMLLPVSPCRFLRSATSLFMDIHAGNIDIDTMKRSQRERYELISSRPQATDVCSRIYRRVEHE